ncbi:MAG: biotin--[acetyl-CoA-carboxylase] ligase [Aquificaceae bacterium]
MLWFEELSSTQDFLKDKSLPFGTLVVSNRQTRGRGRYGRSWYSQDGGLYFSFLLEDMNNLRELPLVLGLSVCEFLENIGIVPSIKWVNDVYVKGKKICGILVEKSRGRVIVGIGLNVNQDSFPSGIQATSMLLTTGKEYRCVDVLLALIDHISKNLDIFKRQGFLALRDKIKDRLLFIGQEVIIYNDPPVVGILTDLSEKGELVVITAEGSKKIISGDLTLRGFGLF